MSDIVLLFIVLCIVIIILCVNVIIEIKEKEYKNNSKFNDDKFCFENIIKLTKEVENLKDEINIIKRKQHDDLK